MSRTIFCIQKKAFCVPKKILYPQFVLYLNKNASPFPHARFGWSWYFGVVPSFPWPNPKSSAREPSIRTPASYAQHCLHCKIDVMICVYCANHLSHLSPFCNRSCLFVDRMSSRLIRAKCKHVFTSRKHFWQFACISNSSFLIWWSSKQGVGNLVKLLHNHVCRFTVSLNEFSGMSLHVDGQRWSFCTRLSHPTDLNILLRCLMSFSFGCIPVEFPRFFPRSDDYGIVKKFCEEGMCVNLHV